MTVTGVVLAAGAGRRYGTPKVLAEGGAWLRAAVRALAEGGCDRVHVALGAAPTDVPPPADAIQVPDWDDGMSASVRRAVDAAEEDGADAVLLHLVDLPDVGPGVVARVLATPGERPGQVARAAYGGVPGHPVLIGRDHWDALRAGMVGDEGARGYLRGAGPVLVECADLATGVDRDTRRT